MKRIRNYLALMLMLCIGFTAANYIDMQSAYANELTQDEGETVAVKTEETEGEDEQEIEAELPTYGTLKILVTADLHGQVTARNYEIDREEPNRGLSKLMTLINQERAATDSETVLLDAGDTLYSYATDFFYDYNDELVQPIYQAMALLDYDAVTLGNHELDHPWEYVLKQLQGSGLYEKTTVRNLLYDDTGETAFAPSIVMTKQIVMSDGTVQPVQVGVVGATRESLSAKHQRYSGLLCGRNIYDSVSAEAKRLKENGVDVVIALIHGGIGLISSDATVSPGAKLAKLAEIDAVVTSHTHELFPEDMGEYEKFSYVNEENGLIYGKPVVAIDSHAENLGVMELEITYDEAGALVVKGTGSRIVPVTEEVEEAEEIVKVFERFERYLKKKGDNRSFALAEGTLLTNADCVVNDSALYQLLNNAKISFGVSYIQEYLPAYADFPVVAVTKNELDSQERYITIESEITAADVAEIIGTASATRPSGYLYLYKITGANLREWLEYSASIYAQKGTKFTTILPNFTKKNTGVSTLLNEEYLQDWNSFFAFDGISYEIDLEQPARYNADGTMVSYKNYRITNLKYQGKDVTNKQEFVIVSDTYERNFWFMPVETDSIYANFPYINGKDVVMDYLEEQAKFGPISVVPDNNWCFQDSENYEFAFGTEQGTLAYGKERDWYYKHVSGLRSGLQFFWGKYVTRPRMLAAELSRCLTKETGGYVPVKVTVVSLPENAQVKEMVYRKGQLTDPEDLNWSLATRINNGVFNVSNNGIYSVRITDTEGNRIISYIYVDNIDPSIVAVPGVEFVTNRRRAVNGVSVPYSTVWIETADGTRYSAQADEGGKYSVELPPQPAGSTLLLWATEGTRESEKIEVPIYRTGPNLPTAAELMPGDAGIYCVVEEKQTPAIIIGKNVYIETGMGERYKKSGIYNSSYKIVETEVIWCDETTCYIPLPEMKQGTKYYLYAFDWQNRESLRTEFTVQ